MQPWHPLLQLLNPIPATKHSHPHRLQYPINPPSFHTINLCMNTLGILLQNTCANSAFTLIPNLVTFVFSANRLTLHLFLYPQKTKLQSNSLVFFVVLLLHAHLVIQFMFSPLSMKQQNNHGYTSYLTNNQTLFSLFSNAG